MKAPFRIKQAIAALLSSLLVGWACTSGIIPATGERKYLGFTWEEEREVGEQAAQEIAAVFGIYGDAQLDRYVDQVGRRVLAESHLRGPGAEEQFLNTPVTFRILDSPNINAMAIPGGHIYVTRGLLAHLNNVDQLAFVLAHEIGHITARHAARRAWQQQFGQGLLLGGAVLGQAFGLPAGQILNLGGTAAQLIFLRHSREDELEADTLAVRYASRAGFQPREATGFFRALAQVQEREGAGLPNFLSTHPNPGNRLERIEELAAEWKIPRRFQEMDLAGYFAAIEGIVLGEDPRHGFVRGQVFFHPELRFRFPVPQGFRLVNQPTQVVMIENQRRAIIGFTLTGEKSLQAAADKFLSQPGLRVRETFTQQPDDLTAIGAVADAQSQNGDSVRLLVYFVQHREHVYQFIAYSAPQSFAFFTNEFLRVVRGFENLNDPELLSTQPVRLELQRAPRTAALRSLIPATLPNELRPEDVAILNQIALNEDVEEGRVLKLPGD